MKKANYLYPKMTSSPTDHLITTSNSFHEIFLFNDKWIYVNISKIKHLYLAGENIIEKETTT